MRFLTRLARIFGCRHHDTFREYRGTGKARVLYLVCLDCEKAVPAIDRTPAERRKMAKVWKPAMPVKATRVKPGADVLPMPQRGPR